MAGHRAPGGIVALGELVAALQVVIALFSGDEALILALLSVSWGSLGIISFREPFVSLLSSGGPSLRTWVALG
jgi:hypothetical protein